MKILNTTQSLNRLIDRLNNSDRVFFTRYGDNDIMMMSGTDLYGKPLGKKAYGGNRTIWSPQLQKEIMDSFVIKDKNYLKGVSASWAKEPGMEHGCFAGFPYRKNLEQKVTQITDEQEFLIPILFHYLICFKPSIFDAFVDKYIRSKDVMFIGSSPLEHVEKIIGKVKYYVKTPQITAYHSIDKWWPNVEKDIDKVNMVIPTCGQCSRVVQNRLWGRDVSSIDMGSLFDALSPKPTRTWIKKRGDLIRQRYGNGSNK